MKKFCFGVVLIILFVLQTESQVVYEPITNNPVYDLLDELATLKIITINSVVKPYSRVYIAEKLDEAANKLGIRNETVKKRVSKRIIDEIKFYLRDYGFELGIKNEELRIQSIKLNVQDSILSNNSKFLIPNSSFNYNPLSFNLFTKAFKLSLRPALGARFIVNENGNVWDLTGGGEVFGYVGKHVGYYFNIKQTWQSEALVKPEYFTLEEGKVWSNAGNSSVTNTEWRGGISVAWKWGDFGLYKDRPVWGNGVHGTNILSGHAPSFPFIQLHIKPAKWIEFWYLQGILQTNYFSDLEKSDTANLYDVSHQKKFIVANMISFYPWKELSLSLGNSIIYTSEKIIPAFLIPDQFFKATDQTLESLSVVNGQNNQLFFAIDLRLIRQMNFYFSTYIEDIKMKAFWSSNQINEIGVKVGLKLSNIPFKNFFLIFEYTKTNPLTYQHWVTPTEFYSNGYCLGNYLRDDSQEFFINLRYIPWHFLRIDFHYNYVKHGIDYKIAKDINNYFLPFIGEVTYKRNTFQGIVNILFLSRLTGWISYTWQDLRGDIKYSPEIFLGKTNTLEVGINVGF